LEPFGIQLTRSAADDLNHVSDNLRRQILSDIKNLSANPFLFGKNIKKLKSFKAPLYRLRSGNFRVIYRVEKQIITIMRVIDRKELERIIKRLKL
jgi:mRNA-degrading endonuclease RelE of RelBE toxin-antitoxin system